MGSRALRALSDLLWALCYECEGDVYDVGELPELQEDLQDEDCRCLGLCCVVLCHLFVYRMSFRGDFKNSGLNSFQIVILMCMRLRDFR